MYILISLLLQHFHILVFPPLIVLLTFRYCFVLQQRVTSQQLLPDEQMRGHQAIGKDDDVEDDDDDDGADVMKNSIPQNPVEDIKLEPTTSLSTTSAVGKRKKRQREEVQSKTVEVVLASGRRGRRKRSLA